MIMIQKNPLKLKIFFIFSLFSIFSIFLYSLEKPLLGSSSSHSASKEMAKFFEKGEMFYKQGIFNSAIKMFKKSLSFASSKPPLTLKYIDLCKRRMDWEEKRQNLLLKIKIQEFSLEQEKKIKRFLERGIQLYKKRQMSKALIEFKKVIHLKQNDHPIASKYIKNIEDFLKKKKEKQLEDIEEKDHLEEFLTKATRIKKMREKAMLLLYHHEFSLALSLFQELLQSKPKDEWLVKYINLCTENLSLEKTQKNIEWEWSQKYFKKAIQEKNFKEEKLKKMFQETKKFIKQEKYFLAQKSLNKLLEMNPKNKIIQKNIEVIKEIIHLRENFSHQELLTKTILLKSENEWKLASENFENNQKLCEKAKDLFQKKKYARAIPIFNFLSKTNSHKTIALEYEKICQRFLDSQKVYLEMTKKITQDVLLKRSLKIIFEKGKKMYQEKKYLESMAHMKAVISKNPEDSFAPQYIDLCQKNLKLKKERERIVLQKEKILLKKKSQSLQTMQIISFNSSLKKGKILFISHHYNEALSCFQSIFSSQLDANQISLVQHWIEQCVIQIKSLKEKENLENNYKKALKAYQSQQWKKAHTLLSNLYEKYPQFKDVYLYLKLTRKQMKAH